MLIQFNVGAVESPGLPVFSNDGKLARLVALLQATGDSLHMPRRLLLRFLFLLFLCGLGFCSANFRKERLGCGWDPHFAQQQSPSCDLASIHRVPGITVLADRCTFQREPSERTLGTGVGQDLCIHLPIRTGRGMPTNWTSRRW